MRLKESDIKHKSLNILTETNNAYVWKQKRPNGRPKEADKMLFGLERLEQERSLKEQESATGLSSLLTGK